jgi:outer membrane protein assembly factor BamA
MRRLLFASVFVAFVSASALPAPAQKFLPKSIQFQGAPEYSTEELMAAAGLKKGVVLSYADMNAVSKRLVDTGVFATLAFKFDGQDLIFTITPSTDLVPIRLDNLPLEPGPALDARIHEQIPLFHGKVPIDGGLTEDVRVALEKILAAEGVEAHVTRTNGADLATQKVNLVIFSITGQAVQVKVNRIEGVSVQNQGKVSALVAHAANDTFDTMHSANNIETLVEQYYHDLGYAAVKVHVARDGKPAMSAGAIVVPFSVHVEEGKIYAVKSIQLPGDALVTQDEADKTLASASPGTPQGVRVRSVWELISTRYKSKGYLDCKVTPHASLDDASHTVSYTVDIDPGPVYHLGFVKFDNVSDAMRTLLIHNWEMLPGDPFDESYVANFIVKAQAQDPVLRRSLAGVKASFDATSDPHTHIVNVVIRLEK